MTKLDYARNIDFTGLFRYAETFTQTVLTFDKPEINESSGVISVNFKSENIAHTCGLFGQILESCTVESSSNYVVENYDGDLRYWVQVSVRYTHKDGGSNGMDLFRAFYENDTWTFR